MVFPVTALLARTRVTTKKVEVSEATVTWICQAPSATEENEQPPEKLNSEQLNNATLIGLPSAETLHVNSIRLLNVTREDRLVTFTKWLNNFHERYMRGVYPENPKFRNPAFGEIRVCKLIKCRVQNATIVYVKFASRCTHTWGSIPSKSFQSTRSLKLPGPTERPQGWRRVAFLSFVCL